MFSLIIVVQLCTSVLGVNRIIGGSFASPGQFPHQVSLQLNGRHHCGGSFISEKFIITAAHCTIRQSPSNMAVIAGTNDLSQGGVRADISKFVIHPQYNPQTQDYDISIIILNAPVQFNENIKEIKMAEPDSNAAANTLATISGFGAINENLELPNMLKYAKVQLWSRDYCNGKNIPGVTDRMICAGHPSGQIGSCQGDSGGPLTVNNELFGLVSWGFGCGSPGKPAMYTFVGGLRPWIKQITGF